MAKVDCVRTPFIVATVAAIISMAMSAPSSGLVQNQKSWPFVKSLIQSRMKETLAKMPPEIVHMVNSAGQLKPLPGKKQGSEADNNIPTPEMIANEGYPVEVHSVTTEDGYILQMHRIPYGKAPGSGVGEGSKTPVLVQHGLLSSSADWVVIGTQDGLGYRLADAGFDVWLGNIRGNTYSRNHETISSEDSAFWQYDWDHHGKLDLPAEIDLVSSVSGKQDMFYIGHSMGNTMFFVMSNERPEYRDRIKAHFALSPVARVDHMKSPMAYLAPFLDEVNWLLDLFGQDEFLPSDAGIDILANLFCIPDGLATELCSNILFILCGYDEAQLNDELLPTLLGHTPAGTSTNTVVHYAQQVNSGAFQRFDYGPSGNMEQYGKPYPPEYDLEMVTTPVYSYWSENDWLCDPRDAFWFMNGIPNLQLDYKVPFPEFNHLDFLWAIDVGVLLYDDVLERITALDAMST